MRLSEEFVPSKLKDVHDYLIVLRDKLFAHVDEKAPSDWEVKHLSKILIGHRGGDFRPAFAQLFRDGFQLESVKELCEIQSQACHAKSDTILQAAMDGTIPPSVLTYEVDLSEGDQYLLKMRQLREHRA